MNLLTLKDSKRFWTKVNISDGCWIWNSSRNKTGYGTFSIKHHPYKAHRVAWEQTFGEIPKGFHVLHRCDNPPCVNPEHLFLGTHQDNMRDMDMKGRRAKPNGMNTPVGSDSPNSVLREDHVRQIRSQKGKVSYRDLAEQYGVGYSTIRHIMNFDTWKHVR